MARKEHRVDDGLQQQIGFKLSRASRLMQRRLEAALATQGQTRLTWCVLSSIGLEGISTPSGIADNLGVTRPMLSRLIKTMSDDGLITVSLDPDDGRTRQLRLTDQGQTTLAACVPLVRGNNQHFAAKLTPEQMGCLHAVLDALVEGEMPYLDTF